MPASTQSPMVPGWKVVAQTETTRPGPGTTFVRGVTITWQSDDGETGTVFVPDANYTPDTVRTLVAGAVAMRHSIGTLSG